ncbi:LysM peptidoglycan-binding domain-containing M23 family metallopeptidase [Hyphomicrobium facile]|uniref:Murein DD-endopeptidase MepM and murein hydrolase activator NlpD, contain LysM domain n=1 Tax=Hyphomicrobium facile TaxID=51670 RepID=A0A1I7NED3_9HYPH|nr:LysM peptidoglycan-binding domain-containing M23 family metallopeptidase [Hyphomicrobium facile]SFV33035.1 Murein DD-endopeptidase MepM and murein hydrolase activator NlpD, contain LysM domain [Hyphomicrobium facile]
MMSCFGVSQCGRLSLKSATAVSLIIASLGLSGCSADVTRFDSTSFNFNDSPGATPIPSEPVRTSSLGDNQTVGGSTPRGPYGAGASSVQVAALPEATGDHGSTNYYAPQPPPPPQAPAASTSYRPAKPFARTPSEPSYGRDMAAARSAPPAAPVAKGEMIAVQPGDTLYGLSRRHQVSLTELTSLNGLSNPNLKPGQKLYLPAAGASIDRSSVAAAKAVEAATPLPAPLAPAAPDVVANYNGTYTVKPGDSLYGIARSNNVKLAELQQVNGISDPRRVKPGTVLKVPGESANEAPSRMAESKPVLPSYAPPHSVPPLAPASASAAPLPPAQSAAAVVPPITPSEPPARYGDSTTAQPTVINGERRVASLSDNKVTDASPDPSPAAAPVQATQPTLPAAPEQKPSPPEEKVAVAVPSAVAEGAASSANNSGKLRWPTIGKIVAGFGSRSDGTHNDGINLQVPLGTEVHAAESGVVAYAGSELKGYGNLVLLRHDNGWVTAYAHNDELLVKRGDKIKRGQVIAKAGKTGSVDQPQVHFELRQGSKPVDPMPYLEKL